MHVFCGIARVATVNDPHDPLTTIDPTRASVARVYDAALGGKDNFAVDRDMLAKILVQAPDAFESPRMVRDFGRRAVEFLARRGIRQFLDLGSGIPSTPPSVHETAWTIAPDTRVVYVDKDPVVVAHSRALRDVGEGLVSVFGDVTEPESVFQNPRVLEVLDFSAPVGVLLISVLQNVLEDDQAQDVVGRIADRMAPGSYLAVAHISTRSQPAAMDGVHRSAEQAGYPPTLFREDESIRALFDRFELVEPGVVDIKDWRPSATDVKPVNIKLLGGVGYKTD